MTIVTFKEFVDEYGEDEVSEAVRKAARTSRVVEVKTENYTPEGEKLFTYRVIPEGSVIKVEHYWNRDPSKHPEELPQHVDYVDIGGVG